MEGFGGTVELPTTALAAANVERDREHAMYPDTNVMAHEFGHAFHLIGIKTADPELFDEIDATYEKVVLQEGKWANSYAGSNRDEYFGQLAALWFNGQAETQTWNGVLGPVNTRDELKEYDPESYAATGEDLPRRQIFRFALGEGRYPSITSISTEIPGIKTLFVVHTYALQTDSPCFRQETAVSYHAAAVLIISLFYLDKFVLALTISANCLDHASFFQKIQQISCCSY